MKQNRIIRVFCAVCVAVLSLSCSKDGSQGGAKLELSQHELSWPSDSKAPQLVSVTANGAWTATVSDPDNWVLDIRDDKSFLVHPRSENTTGDVLTATVTVTSQGLTATVALTMLDITPELSVSPTSLSWKYNDLASKTVNVTSNCTWSATVEDETNWVISISGDKKSFTVRPKSQNNSSAERSTVVTVSAKYLTETVSCTMEAKPEAKLQIDKTSLNWSYNQTSAQTVNVTANYSWTVSFVSGDFSDWTLKTYSNYFTITPAAVNKTDSPITATFQVNSQGLSQTVTCTQRGDGPFINGIEYVDLGLPSGILWAVCNIGASSKSDDGYTFGWGMTTPYGSTTPSWTYYFSSIGGSGTSKDDCGTSKDPLKTYVAGGFNYSQTTKPGVEEGLNGTPYDTGYKYGYWRMPTKAEFEELLQYCTIVNSYYFKKGDKELYFPDGYYWAATAAENYAYGAYSLRVGYNSSLIMTNSRYLGCSVRQVYVRK
ncbi:MAG: hypothetical protein HUJ95_03345 [Bacteroidales bacterium]|nr:hypothetical protein [Bacteroidales bacterium]